MVKTPQGLAQQTAAQETTQNKTTITTKWQTANKACANLENRFYCFFNNQKLQ